MEIHTIQVKVKITENIKRYTMIKVVRSPKKLLTALFYFYKPKISSYYVTKTERNRIDCDSGHSS